jgi:hypothetical protein
MSAPPIITADTPITIGGYILLMSVVPLLALAGN